jgi:hypothetical protein
MDRFMVPKAIVRGAALSVDTLCHASVDIGIPTVLISTEHFDPDHAHVHSPVIDSTSQSPTPATDTSPTTTVSGYCGSCDTPPLDMPATPPPIVGLKYCIGEVSVRVIDDDRQHVESVDPDTDDVVYFELGGKNVSKWFVDAFGVLPMRTHTYAKIKHALNAQFGTHTRRHWVVGNNRTPIASPTLHICVDDVNLTVLLRRRTLCIAATTASLSWLTASVTAERIPCDSDTTTHYSPGQLPDHDDRQVLEPFSIDDLQLMANHHVKWRPSRRTLVCYRTGQPLFTGHQIKVKVDMRRRKRLGDDKFNAYVAKRAKKAMHAALTLVASTQWANDDGPYDADSGSDTDNSAADSAT